MKVELVHVFALNVFGVCLFLGLGWFFLAFCFGLFLFCCCCCWLLVSFFLNEESLLSAEQLLKQWIIAVVYFCDI